MNVENIIRTRIERWVLPMNKKIILYPFGKYGNWIKEILNLEYGIKEFMIIDNNLCKSNHDIQSLEALNKIDCDDYLVVLTSSNIDIYDELRTELFKKVPEKNVVDLFGTVNLDIDTRIEAMRLMAKTINQFKLDGAVAEAGVYKGDFSQYINRFFKSKQLYLFDTFEGFENKHLKKNVDEYWDKWMKITQDYVNSDIDLVLNKMPYPKNCIIRKGFFPESGVDISENFCFVSLDMDIYQSTKDGLAFFWPKMVKRGIIMIHDYNNVHCSGVKKAVDEFADENEIGVICLADAAGSAVLTK